MDTGSRDLGVIDFGELLVNTLDLDPVYCLVHGANWKLPKLKRWLLAYWCFYHMGTASWIVDQPDFWYAMLQAAESNDYPRSRERRHFRAKLARNTVLWLEQEGVYCLYDPILREANRTRPVSEVIKYVKTWYGFGDWIAFKVADMLERLGLARINFDGSSVFLFESPREGAELVWEREGIGIRPDDVGSWALKYVLEGLRGYDAPPRAERPLNNQEAETILCKWKSYLNGHYQIGEDIEACKEALRRFHKVSPTARYLHDDVGTTWGFW